MRFFREYFPRSRPRAAQGGIKAQSKRFGESWWAKRWLEVLESFDIGARLSRGRSYARNGQVLSIGIDKGTVQAKVQGSRPTPYAIAIKVKTLTHADWKKVASALLSQALFAAKLLAGEMPQDIEEVFLQAKVSLFPAKHDDLQTDCSCPDWSNPCKHVAAVYYLIGEEFDRDPFLLFKLRGLSKDELLKLLKQDQEPARKKTDARAPKQETPGEPLPTDPARFWQTGALPEDVFGVVERPPTPAALPKRLGAFPFWRGQERFLEAMESIYRAASARGLEVFLAEKSLS
ncbi:MAG: SWIM zinc finger family protein [Gemmataceae bacterium]|nr:SWIM zinc finger family protein [Gemmataceae bacterium]MCI0740639.1 SWIM zinc finger family protein [Gemmataceae bacterium]